MDRKRVGIYAIATAALAGGGQIFLAFGPVAFGEWLGSGKPAEQTQHRESQASPLPPTALGTQAGQRRFDVSPSEVIDRNSDVIQGLNDTLRRIALETKRSDEGAVTHETADMQPSAPERHASAPPAVVPSTRRGDRPDEASPKDDGAADGPRVGFDDRDARPELTPVVLPRGDLPERPPAGDRPPRESKKAPDRTTRDAGEPAARSFGVFENEAFELCGYTGFTARLLDGGASGIVLRSGDSAIPDRSFRGYEKRLALKTPVDLWPGCTVAVGSTDQASVRRLVFSVVSGGSQ